MIAAANAPPGPPGDAEVAVVAMHARLPGAGDTRAFWRTIASGATCFGSLEARPFHADLLDLCRRQGLDARATARAGLLDAPYGFDAQFFNLSLAEAEALDPHARLLLETVAELLEEAFIAPHDLDGSRTALFVGLSGSDHVQRMVRNLAAGEEIGIRHALGGSASAAVGRVSRHFNWKGPAEALDTACSSSLVAVARGVDALRLRRADVVVAGGVNLILSHLPSIAFMAGGMLSPDGACRPFDARANGYVRGEGCGLVMLKRLYDAERDGDAVLAVVRGSAVNHNGASNGLTAPNPRSQAELIADAWGGLAGRVDYIEAHGTGTRLGDPIEMRALAECLAGVPRPVPVGSVKANIGHLEAAAGAAGLIKAILVGRHGLAPPQAGFAELNPLLARYAGTLRVADAAIPLEGGAFHVGVSSFGFSGTNAHLLLEVPRAPARALTPRPAGPILLGVSAHALPALARRLDDLAAAFSGAAAEPADFHGLVREAQFLPHYRKRAAFLAGDAPELLRAMRSAAGAVPGYADPEPRALGLSLGEDGVPEARGGNARALLLLLAEQGLRVGLGGVEPARFGRNPAGLVDEVMARGGGEAAADGMTLLVGDDLRLRGDMFAGRYGPDPERNTAVTLGMLYAAGCIDRLPRWGGTRPAAKRLPHYPFARLASLEPTTDRAEEALPAAPSNVAANDGPVPPPLPLPLHRLRESWRAAGPLPAPAAPCRLIGPAGIGAATMARAGWTQAASGRTTEGHHAALARADRLPDVRGACGAVLAALARIAACDALAAASPKFHVLVDGAGAAAAPLEGALAGLMATLALERPALAGLLVRMDDAADAACWDQAARLLASPLSAAEAHARVTAAGARFKRLEPAAEFPGAPNALRGRGVIVTGASASIGPAIVRRVIAERPARLLLLGRRPLQAPLAALLDVAAEARIAAAYVRADLSDAAALAQALAPHLADDSAGDTIIHAAGDPGERRAAASLGRVGPEAGAGGAGMGKAWAAKADGLLNLLDAVGPRVRRITLVSSVSALWGLAGHAEYAMANGFLLGLAAPGAMGCEVRCQAWGVWDGSAMRRAAADEATLRALGLGSIDPVRAADLLAASFGGPPGATAIAAMDPAIVARGLARDGLFAELAAAPARRAAEVAPARQAAAATSQDVVDFIVAHLRGCEGFLLDLPSDLRRGLFDLGLNSITIVGLGGRLEQAFGVPVGGNDMFAAGTIAGMAGLIAERSRSGGGAGEGGGGGGPPEHAWGGAAAP